MNHCSCDCDACSCSCIDGSATLRIVLSITTTIRQMQRTPSTHQRRAWTDLSRVPSATGSRLARTSPAARVRAATIPACPTLSARNDHGGAHWWSPGTRTGLEALEVGMTEAEGL